MRCEPSHRSASPLALQCGHLGQLYITYTEGVEHGVSWLPCAQCGRSQCVPREPCNFAIVASRSLSRSASSAFRFRRAAVELDVPLDVLLPPATLVRRLRAREAAVLALRLWHVLGTSPINVHHALGAPHLEVIRTWVAVTMPLQPLGW